MKYDPKIHFIFKCPYCENYFSMPISKKYKVQEYNSTIDCSECNNEFSIYHNLVDGYNLYEYEKECSKERRKAFYSQDLIGWIVIVILSSLIVIPIIAYIYSKFY